MNEELKKRIEEGKLALKDAGKLALKELKEINNNAIDKLNQVNIPIELCNPDAKLPTYANDGDSGMDVYVLESVQLNSQETKIIQTGLKFAIPKGFEIQVRPRSGVSYKTMLRISNSPGTIDSGYRNELGIIVTNTGKELCVIEKGDRIAQIVLQKVPKMNLQIVDSVKDIGNDRKGGFGSTGK